MNDSQGDTSDDENALVKLTSLLVLGAGLLGLFLGIDNFWLIFALGFAVVVPIVKVLTDEFGSDSTKPSDTSVSTEVESDESTTKQDALDTLRDRYARGDLTEEAFERKVENLLETETPESARGHVAREESDDHETESFERAN